MKKILLYIDMMYRGGAQRVMSNLAGHFAETGVEVVLCNDFVQDEALPKYDVSDKVKRVYLLEKLEGNLIVKNIRRVLRLRRLIREEAPDCVLSFLGRPNLRMLIASIGLKTRKFVSVRNNPAKEYGTGIKKRLADALFRLADGCVFQTADAMKAFPESIQKQSKIILNPVDERFFSIRAAEQRSDIITAGRLVPQKNHKLLIDAFSMIASRHPSQRLLIYGDGPDLQALKAHAKEKGVEARVVFMGNVPDMEDALSKAKVFALSSNFEGLPNALMEAMAAGLACVSTDCPCGGPATLIQNEAHGLLVPCKDADALAAAMDRVLSDEALAKRLAAAARERAEMFRAEAVWNDWDAYLLNR